MRTAICYYGILGSKGGPGGIGDVILPKECFASIRKYIIDVNENVDIFVHSWSVEHTNAITTTLRPKKFIIEKQIAFDKAKLHREPIRCIHDVRAAFSRNLRCWIDPTEKINRLESARKSYSRWYSTKKVLEIKAKYEQEQNIKYDFVLLLRFDVEFYSFLRFCNYSNRYFYAPHWNDLPRPENGHKICFNQNYLGSGFLDLWFFSGSAIMDSFGKLFDNLKDYNISPHFAPYQHVCKFIGEHKIKYTMYRWVDFEMVRAKKYGVLPPHTGVSTLDLLLNKFLLDKPRFKK